MEGLSGRERSTFELLKSFRLECSTESMLAQKKFTMCSLRELKKLKLIQLKLSESKGSVGPG